MQPSVNAQNKTCKNIGKVMHTITTNIQPYTDERHASIHCKQVSKHVYVRGEIVNSTHRYYSGKYREINGDECESIWFCCYILIQCKKYKSYEFSFVENLAPNG